MIMTALIMFW